MSGPAGILQLGRDVALLGMARALSSLLGFVAVTLLAARLDASTLGLWSMLLAVQGYALHVSEMGLRSVVTAEAPRCAGGPLALLRPYLTLRLPLAVLVTLLGFALIRAVDPASSLPGVLVLASVLPIALQFDWLALVNARYASAAFLLLVRPAAWVALLVLTAAADLESLAFLFLLAWTAAALASLPELFRPQLAAGDGARGDLRERDLLGLGWPLFLATLANQAMLSADLLVVGTVVGSEAAGHYYLASAIAVAGLVFANALGQYALSVLGKADAGGSVAGEGGFAAMLRLSLLLGAAATIGGAVLIPLLVPLLFGEGYAPAASLFLYLLPWLFLQYPSTVLQAACVASRRNRQLLRANTVMLAVFAAGVVLAALLAVPELAALSRGIAEIARIWLLSRVLARRDSVPLGFSGGTAALLARSRSG